MWSSAYPLATGGSEPPVKFDAMGDEDGVYDRIQIGDHEPFNIKQGEKVHS